VLSRILADFILLFHFFFVVFAIFGGFLVLYKRWAVWIHVPVVLWAWVVNFVGWICPLTPFENFFRFAAGQEGYGGGFIEHYIVLMIYPGGMTRQMELAAAISILVWNGFVYTFVTFRLWRNQL
jgi:hypothetical protein